MAADVFSLGSGVATSGGGGAGGKLDKAYLAVVGELAPGGGGGSVITPVSGKRMEFLFNPKEYSISKSTRAPRQTTPNAAGSAPPQFTGPEPQTMSIEMFLDATEDAGSDKVTEYVTFLMESCSATSESRNNRQPSLPVVVFGWGATTSFPAFIKQVTVKYTMFRQNGAPVRATCTVQLEEVPDPPKGQNPTSGGEAARRSHTMVVGDSLASIAWSEYRDPTVWRAIAERNGVSDPMRVAPGRQLLMPPLDDARRRR
jgi:nucleoid-associated protein YgaU